MLKKVGSSGQISLGQKFAWQLFDVHAHPDGRFDLKPVQVVPQRSVGLAVDAMVDAGWLAPGGYAQ